MAIRFPEYDRVGSFNYATAKLYINLVNQVVRVERMLSTFDNETRQRIIEDARSVVESQRMRHENARSRREAYRMARVENND